MKNLLPYLAGLFGIALCCFLISAKGIKSNRETTGFVADSGYITPANVLQLLKIDPSDTLYTIDLNAPVTDTLGKYYKMANGNYISSVRVIAHYGYMLCEARPDGTVLKKEKYIFNNFECCWNGIDNCLRKYGNYYTFLTCGTGTAYCGGELYVFNDIIPQEKQVGITESIWAWTGKKDIYKDLSSKMEMSGDTVIMHYTHCFYREKKNGKHKVKKEQHLDAKYIQQNGKWAAIDSVKVNAFLYQ
ncbi:hypothetical protein AM493_04370 [Flavobacterium akiainvivens]|uniref:Uncharacterized protein n=1 Tax=Flavobacterium akiainvivens TaxID=1202724 RepID=A0A0M9VHA9_9FLAO|nr:hypothetical protein [Flavobacterium akiainvivens]KOS05350.1 hypothetical protein AM493_04370 [Flavobacterium akiainvivens]SFQ76787.1 hypothetical protein SAMN05444144_12428 [Flavobacterium akiainvivens]